MKKKAGLVLVIVVFVANILSACSGSYVEKIDTSKTQLYVSNFDGGIGTEWLDNIKASFEAEYADIEFEPGTGKKGAEIVIDAGKENATASLSTSRYEVFFTEQVFYNDLISQGNLLDISDIVRETLPNETKTIEDKLTDSQIEAFTALNGNFYVLPHYEVYSGVSYDIDLFYQKGFFLDKNGGYTKLDEQKSTGPDGVYGTNDDGLPATYEEFFDLCERMTNFNVTPFIWKGEGYPNKLLLGVWSAYAGKEEFYLNVNYGGSGVGTSTEIITGFNDNQPIVENVMINERNAYLLTQQAGKYYGYDFLNKIFSNEKYYNSKGLNNAFSHLDVQTEYIYSSLENNPIAMLIEGNYWYNEAADALKRSINTYGERAENRNFGWMPLPTAVSGNLQESESNKTTLCDSLTSFAFINANIADKPNQVNLAKLFLKYCYRDNSLQGFTTATGMAKGVDYSLTQEQYEGMVPYFKNMYDLRNNSEIVYPYSNHPIFINNQSKYSFDNASTIWNSQLSSGKYNNALTAYKDGISAKDYFLGGWATESNWTNSYSKYFRD